MLPLPHWHTHMAVSLPPLCAAAQVNGKVRATLEVAADVASNQEAAVAAAMAAPNVTKHTEGKAVAKVIFVAGKILNIIVK